MGSGNYSLYTQGRHGKRLVLYVSLVLLLVAVCGARYLLTRPTFSAAPASVTRTVAPKPVAPAYTGVTGKYLFTGTVMMGRAVGTAAKGDFNQPFSGMNTLGTYDDTIGVLECPITNRDISYQVQHDQLLFNCKPDWLPTLKKYYPIVNLSSNHLHDMGDDGYAETVKNLQGAGFQVVGNFNPHAEKDNCKAVFLPIRLQAKTGVETTQQLPVAMCSFNYKTIFTPAAGEIESIASWSKIMPVIALMNGGPEYQHQAGAAQMDVAHKLIDNGADFVVGNGTHWAQNTEVYKGKLVVYSMGNFIFDQEDYDGRLALNLSTHMNLKYDTNLAKWLKVGTACASDPTTCRQLAEQQSLTLLQPTYNFDIIASYGGYLKVASKATPEQQKDLELKANWAATKRALSP